jgi:bifunctional non-homologous end joining protein LigD
LLGVDGISDFNGLHSRRHNEVVQLYAFDILALDGEDLRKLPLHLRKNNLSRLLARRPEGIFGLEGLVSKQWDSSYRAGRSPSCVMVKNRSHPARERVKESFA